MSDDEEEEEEAADGCNWKDMKIMILMELGSYSLDKMISKRSKLHDNIS